MDDTISRQEAIKAIEAYFGDLPIKGHYDMLQLIKQLPSAQPEITLESAIDYLHKIGWMQEHDRVLTEYAQPDLDEWCTDCKEYDQKKHCCPRLNRVIRNTVEEIKDARTEQRWIPVEDCERLPDNETDILVTYVDGEETKIVPVNYGRGTWFDCIFDRALNPFKITAWMPLPEPYERSKE